ncbi:MAG: cytochrome c biogenesis protein CcdA [Methylobacterium sp.]|nr:cytochrome c biogenesis protein CcdA [Methylobacterium sp.]
MELGVASYSLSLLAGLLSTLSPCVLPLLPILIGSAVLAHRLGPLALAAGLTLSFTVIGVLIGVAGSAIGLDAQTLRSVAAWLLLGFALLLLLPQLQERVAVAASGVTAGGANLLSRLTIDGLPGQFVVGLLLGVVWSPCVGPTLGAAITLASQGQDLLAVTLVMLVFGLGASAPLIVFGLLSRQVLIRWRGTLLTAGKRGKLLLGALMLVLGITILCGYDKAIEIWVLDHTPGWLVELTTRY